MYRILLLLVLAGFFPVDSEAQESGSFVEKWQARATRTQAEQPKWAVPMVAPFPTLAQVYRTDFTRQITPAGDQNWNLGTGKGFNLIPFARTQVDVLTPGFVTHGDGAADGFGDVAFLAKYRVLSANEQHGNYILSGALGMTVPTGSHKNGAASTVLTPTISGGKGFGQFDVIGSIGAGLPTSGAQTSGRTVHTNAVAQYRVKKYFVPELEVNSTSFVGGAKDGKTQTFLTPGLMVGKFPIRSAESKSRMGILAGVAFQTAVTSYHSYNHSLVMSLRLGF